MRDVQNIAVEPQILGVVRKFAPAVIRLLQIVRLDRSAHGAINDDDALDLRIPMKVVSDSDLIPVAGSEVKAVVFGAKRRWRCYRA